MRAGEINGSGSRRCGLERGLLRRICLRDGRHREDGARCDVKQSLCDASEEQACDGRVSSCADDDHVGVDVTGCVRDHVRGVRRGAAREREARVDAFCAPATSRSRRHRGVNAGAMRVYPIGAAPNHAIAVRSNQ